MSHLSIPIEDISLVTLSRTVYIEDISSIRWNNVKIIDSLSNEFPEGNPEYIALARVREYKNREGLNIYDDVFYRNRIGRSSGENVNFLEYDYETLKTRRKAEVLQYTSKSLTDRELFKRNIGLNNPNKISQTKLKQLRDTNRIINCNSQIDSCSKIPYDKSIPYKDKL
jgi:hypothetical protein